VLPAFHPDLDDFSLLLLREKDKGEHKTEAENGRKQNKEKSKKKISHGSEALTRSGGKVTEELVDAN